MAIRPVKLVLLIIALLAITACESGGSGDSGPSGKLCGGIGAIQCPPGETCVIDVGGPDASGTCS